MIAEPLQQLSRLVAERYGIEAPTLHPVHLFANAGRGIYRVDRREGLPWLLRAQRSEDAEQMAAWFARSAATLLYLEDQGYRASRVIPTCAGQLTCTYQGWAALLLTFVPGTMIAYTPACLQALGEVLGGLHTLEVAATDSSPPLPDGRFRPGCTISGLLSDLQFMSPTVPAGFRSLYSSVVEIVQTVDTLTDLPQAVVHCDCWPTNAIQTPGDQIVLVDWDNAGVGPALLDLGYLLAACHLEAGASHQ